jgi:uroporphyrinogen-III synthase
MHILVTRPEPEASELKTRLAEMGHDVSLSPLIQITFPDVDLPLDGAQALVATSRRGVAALSRQADLETARGLPLFAVGPATAEAARQLGFAHVTEGPGTADGLAGTIGRSLQADGGAVVHLSGDRHAFDLKGSLEARGFEVRQPLLYKTQGADALEAPVQDDIRSRRLNAVILMSPRTARIFRTLISAAGLEDTARDLTYFCLSAAVAKELCPAGATVVQVADAPTLQELLALVTRVASDSP